MALQAQQLPLGSNAITAAKTTQRALLSDHPVTGNENWERVFPRRRSHRARRRSQLLGERAIAPGFTKGNLGDDPPYGFLEFGSPGLEGKIKHAAPSLGILFYLSCRAFQ